MRLIENENRIVYTVCEWEWKKTKWNNINWEERERERAHSCPSSLTGKEEGWSRGDR